MKKRILSIVLCLVMVFSLLPFTASAASAMPINEETFPDPVFREYVLKIVGSSVLTEEKARQIEVLDVSNNRKLVELTVFLNQLTALDVSSNYLLKKLACFENQITALDLRSNKKLQALQCQNNRLSWLDLSSNTALDPAKVDCSGNVYDIKVDENLQYKVYPNLPSYGATEGTYFTAARASDWTGGTVSKVDGWDVLTLDNRDVKEVTYKYDTGNAKIGKVAFTLKTAVPAAYVISSAALTVQSPIEDESAANPTVTTDSSAKYVVEHADWRVSGSMTPYTGAFEKGKSYTLNLLLAPKSGYHFADSESMQVTVNGQKAEKVLPYKDGKLIVTATFAVKNLVTISFDPNGGTGTMQPMKVKSGEKFELPECTFTPPEGKEFAGWLAVNGTVFLAGDNVISFSSSVLKATWKDTAEVDVTQMFTDVTKNWAYPGIQYCVTHQLMSGVGGNLFAPKMTTTRAQIVQILYNLEGEPKVSGTTPFTDLTQNWYKDAVLWAYQTGVVVGTFATTFAPDRPVTREQVATILMNFCQNVKK